MLRRFRNRQGFTLIELMIVVAIIGILAAIAIPNFLRFQAKSKQSEAKTNLAAIGTSAESYRAEKDTYVATFTTLGWSPQGSPRYKYGYGASGSLTYTGNTTVSDSDVTNVDAAATAYTSGAAGNIDSDSTVDRWNYYDSRTLSNTQDDVAN
ncbi:MAG: prepilin-type N-terminal cleavage/methylation domain-containing protein [Deltaproteobacteria bacterium]|nr:prepilin-type N-terminal cleavage/methylation domain-containing protein [Deltaproteobacteria bacterium]